ncbi:unnamed protein product (macronuclear) [Paramecium tetraurelia]|uniref:CDT1 Geminin-binding domain-containing protein n=1 Tax=Paramecium tetraurelia TaxID=5888 RepID=A0C9F7_PARTE|nr:uncharacterized protein GSPATT00006730001 [Paramecium tetraurelia]CAK67424.1 unnamed protein product [Paramecium tetraurelia]|eukprot:XP_001434821.1 hypothetical protein (macronuclear) [Paramecium tetraurelia strain d4-2]
MSFLQPKNKFQKQLADYLNETSFKKIKEFSDIKKNKKLPLPIIQAIKQTPDIFSLQTQDEVQINLDDFKFEPQNKQKTWQTQLIEAQLKAQPIYHQIYGYCLVQSKFDLLMERLQLLRKSLFKKKMPKDDIHKIEEFMPFYILRRMAMQLPTDIYDMNSFCQDRSIAEAFLKEIKYFLKQQNIDKSLIFYHPKMYEQSDDQLEYLLAEFMELDKQILSGYEEQIKVHPSKQLKC